MRSDIFFDLINEMALLPERWDIRNELLCFFFTAHRGRIRIQTGLFVGKVYADAVWRLSFSQNRAFRRIMRSIVLQREHEELEKIATDIHRMTLPSDESLDESKERKG